MSPEATSPEVTAAIAHWEDVIRHNWPKRHLRPIPGEGRFYRDAVLWCVRRIRKLRVARDRHPRPPW